MGTEATRAVIDRYLKAMTSGDRAGQLELLAPDVVWVPPSTAPIPVTTGAQAIMDALANVVREQFDLTKGLTVDVRRVLVDGDFAVVQQRLTATIKPTGNVYDNQYCWVYEVRDGRIVHMEEYADTIVAGRAMGFL